MALEILYSSISLNYLYILHWGKLEAKGIRQHPKSYYNQFLSLGLTQGYVAKCECPSQFPIIESN